MVTPQKHHLKYEIEQNDWTLSAQQMLYMMQNHNVIEKAFVDDDLNSLRKFAESKTFKELFGEMGFDEAYDRYETTLEASDAT